MNYGFNLYGFNPDFINASNAARQRNAQEEALKQQQMNQMYNIWGQYGQQRNANIEAQKARENAAIEAQKARQFQAEQNALNRAQRDKEIAMQQAINDALINRQQIEAKEAKKRANDTTFADLVTQADDLNSQIELETDPVKKEVLSTKLNAVKTRMDNLGDDYADKYSWDNSAVEELKRQQKQDEYEKDLSSDYRRTFESKLPITIKTNKQKEELLTELDKWKEGGILSENDYNYLVDRVNGYESTQTKVAKANQDVVVSKTAEQTGKNIDEKRIKKALADDGRERMSKGLKPTKAQQDAINEGY